MKINVITVCCIIFALISQSTHALPRASGEVWVETINTNGHGCSTSLYGSCNTSINVTTTEIENNIFTDEKSSAICNTHIGICDISGGKGFKDLNDKELSQESRNNQVQTNLKELSNFTKPD